MVSPFQADYMYSIQTNMWPRGARPRSSGSSRRFRWISARNRLLNVNEGGLVSQLLQFPAGVPMASLEDYLRKNGIRYVLMETNGGYGVPTLDRLQTMAS